VSRTKMINQPDPPSAPEPAEPPAPARAESPGPASRADPVAADQAAPAAAPAGEDELVALRRELQELRDRNLRLMAEIQNQQKRALRAQQEARRLAEADFARDLLVVLDDFERAQEAAQAATDAKSVAEGVRIVYDHLLKVLRDREVTPIDAVGQLFDPDRHEAILQQPSDEHPAGTVLQQVTRGYAMSERVLRPARVVVSSGPPPAQAEPEGKVSESKPPTRDT